MPLHLGAFVLLNIKSIMNDFVEAIGGFKTNDVYYGDILICILQKSIGVK